MYVGAIGLIPIAPLLARCASRLMSPAYSTKVLGHEDENRKLFKIGFFPFAVNCGFESGYTLVSNSQLTKTKNKKEERNEN